MIGTLHWRRLAAGDPDVQRRFATAIGRRLGQPDYRPGIVNDPIAHWIDQDCWRPPSLPSNDYRSLRTFGGRSFRKPHKNSDETRFTSAHWFAVHRRGGDTMLHHRTLAPVILRDWSAPLTLFESAIEATANVSRGTWSKLDHRHGTMPSTFMRPGPAPSDYLDTATEPAAWPQRAQPRSNFNPRPWSPSERPFFVHRKRH